MLENRSKAISGIRGNLTLWFLVLSLAPIVLISWFSNQYAERGLTRAAFADVSDDARSGRLFLKRWFDARFQDLNHQAEDQNNSRLLQDLRRGYLQSGLSARQYVSGLDWMQRIQGKQDHLVRLPRQYDYLYDLFLIDKDGWLLYSVAREKDLGVNLLTGSLAGSRFAESVRWTLETGESRFSDLQRLAGFLTAPLLDRHGEMVGVFAMQIELASVLADLTRAADENAHPHHYLVGDDGILRSPLQHEAEVLKRRPNTLASRGELPAGQPAMYIGPNGDRVIGVRQSLQLPGVNWWFISEIPVETALAELHKLGEVNLYIVASTAILAILLAIFQAQRLTHPIISLASAAKAASRGDLEQSIEISSKNELGDLAKAFNQMLRTRSDFEAQLLSKEHQAAEALKNLKEQKFALDQHSIVAITDVTGTIQFVNKLFCRISGYRYIELLGKNHRILSSGLHDKSFWRNMYRTIARGTVWHGEICNQAKDGHQYWVNTTVVPFMGDNGKPRSYISIRTDITERKKAEQHLLKARDAAEAASRAKSEFLANMSHEIRTPMNGVIGMTNLLLDSQLDRNQQQFARAVKNSAESLLSLINDILDFSKIEAGRLDLEPIDFDLLQLLDDFATGIAFRAHQKGLELICPANLMEQSWYHADPGRIRQILTNLVGNAIKFTETGEIAVYAEIIERQHDHSVLKFRIRDTGIGLDEEQINHLFERFKQADGTSTRKHGGTGLGLAISKQLVEMMDGEIGVDSTEGVGSVFWFTLRLNKARQVPALPSTVDLPSHRALVVDDNATNRSLLDDLLTRWRVDHALADGAEACLARMRRAADAGRPYDMILLDMHMPETDGLELARRIKADEALRNFKLVILTSHGQRGDAELFSQAGFAGYISKPIEQSELYNTLVQVAAISGGSEHLITRYSQRELPQFQARVLVVEDNITNQQVAYGMLSKLGLKIDTVANGLEALDALQRLPYDLVFMDCQMPVMDGYEASRRIRSMDAMVNDPGIPIVAMTANAMRGDREKCLDAGMDDHIAKPIDPSRLERALSQWLPEKCLPEEARHAAAEHQTPAAPNDEQEHPLFDEAGFSDRLMGDRELMKMVSDAFFTDMDDQFPLLAEAAEAGDAEQCGVLGHKIKGASSNVGGMQLSHLSLQMEQAGKGGDKDKIRQLMPSLSSSYEALKLKMEECLG